MLRVTQSGLRDARRNHFSRLFTAQGETHEDTAPTSWVLPTLNQPTSFEAADSVRH